MVLSDKEQKKRFKSIASHDPDAYFPTKVLRSRGFERYTCTKCATHFWSTNPREVCGDPDCVGGFSFIKHSPVTNRYTYPELITAFARFFEERGYTPINRYPIVARWRDDTDFVGASIYNFQPHVVSGSVRPPANPLTVPQPSLRFNDIDNVGITGSHNTCFVMIGQCAFTPPDEFEQDTYFIDLFEWFTIGLGIPPSEIQIHEDAWAGGGNFGPCMEFFSRGLELANQVYMLYEQTETGPRELSLKVLDMGLGAERNAWFSQGKSTSYESTFPTVVSWLREKTGVAIDEELVEKFIPYGSMLNADEAEDLDEAWNRIAQLTGMDATELKAAIKPLAAIYSIADHTRALLFAIADGALPSNVRGGHNLRTLLRRALSLKARYGWDFDLLELFDLHAEYVSSIYPELTSSTGNVKRIVAVEIERFEEQRTRARAIVEKELDRGIDAKRLRVLYESHGITPELATDIARERGIELEVPNNFYADLSEKHTHTERDEKTRTIPSFEGLVTKARYFDDWKRERFTAHVLGLEGDSVVLDETYFYPTSGGQIHDLGTMNTHSVVNITKQGSAIIHEVPEHTLNVGDTVECTIDMDRRLQLAQHHTATHILHTAAKEILGPHIWQAGAEKKLEKARLDITHYQSLTREEELEIEERANEIVAADIPVDKRFMPRDEAEKRYGFVIYQGGAVPGDVLRIVTIEGLDVQACAGTHVDSTGAVGAIKLFRSTRISDGVVRLEYAAGEAAEALLREEHDLTSTLSRLLDCDEAQIPGRCEELFTKWKKARKLAKKKQEVPSMLPLTSLSPYDGDVIDAACAIVQTQPEHLVKTVERFLEDLRSS
jgi:alanyl-tRNA synthetase